MISKTKQLVHNLIYGTNGGLELDDINIQRKKFSDLFPYVAYDGISLFDDPKEWKDWEFTESYFLKDGYVGWVWECSPLVFASESIIGSLSSVYKEPFPYGSIISFSMYADSYIKHILDDYLGHRVAHKPDSIFTEQAKRFNKFLQKGADYGLSHLSGTPVRNFRLFVSIKIPISADISKEPKAFKKEIKGFVPLIKNIQENLKSSFLNPKPLPPDLLIHYIRRLCNTKNVTDYNDDKVVHWDKNLPISKQLIYSDTEIKLHNNYIQMGDNYGMCITPKVLPKEIDALFINNILGYFGVGATSMDDDINQIQSPFIFTINVVYDKIRHKLEKKAQQILMQQAAGTLAPSVMRRKEEVLKMLDTYEQGDRYIRVIPSLWVFDRDIGQLEDKINRTRAIWSTLNIESQLERDFLLPIMFIQAMPLGLYHSNINDMERDFIMPTKTAAAVTPLMGSFKGVGEPMMMFIDRRGQLVPVDIMKTGPNKNFFVTGGTGGGKSFLMNNLVNSYLGIGAKVRIIDVGGSYEKTTSLHRGQYIELAKSKNIKLNFFSQSGNLIGLLPQQTEIYSNLDNFYVKDTNPIAELEVSILEYKKAGDEKYARIAYAFDDHMVEDSGWVKLDKLKKVRYVLDGDSLMMLTSIVASMVSSRANLNMDEESLTIIELAIDYMFTRKQRDTTIDDIYEYLFNADKYLPKAEGDKNTAIAKKAYSIALSLQKYTSNGVYGKYFSGKSNLSFDKQIVVTELDGVPEDLRKVLVLAFATLIEREIYMGDRKTFSIVLLDEAWQTLSENPYAAKFVEGLYRKIRKYFGGVGIVSQSVIDLDPQQGKLKHLGNVIRTQSSFHFGLYDKDFHNAKEKGLIDINDFEYQKFVANIPSKSLPKYSEIYMSTPMGTSTVRLIVDYFTYFLNTSDAQDNNILTYIMSKEKANEPDYEKRLIKSMHIAADKMLEFGGDLNQMRTYYSKLINEEDLALKKERGEIYE